MLINFINHYKKLLQAINLAFLWLIKRIFTESVKAALKKLLQGKNA